MSYSNIEVNMSFLIVFPFANCTHDTTAMSATKRLNRLNSMQFYPKMPVARFFNRETLFPAQRR